MFGDKFKIKSPHEITVWRPIAKRKTHFRGSSERLKFSDSDARNYDIRYRSYFLQT
ncbi:hypothetical protein LEP1GSC040_3500 [Leptospira santarosai str. 2000030832]|nr:hypothetical protein LEP1GSC040_3500 [Leptospira santarosai str. 2000030832]